MSAQKNSEEKAFGQPAMWVALSLMLILMGFSFADMFFLDNKREESIRRALQVEVMALKQAQIASLKEIKDRLIVLESAARKSETQRPEPKEKVEPIPESALDDVTANLESMSDAEYQAMVLEQVKASDRQLVEQHFKRENAFKAALNPAQKQKFAADVKKEYVKLLASSDGESELSSLQKEVFRRSAESMVIAEWRAKESAEEQDARIAARIAQRREENRRLWDDETMAEMIEKFGAERVEQLMKEINDE